MSVLNTRGLGATVYTCPYVSLYTNTHIITHTHTLKCIHIHIHIWVYTCIHIDRHAKLIPLNMYNSLYLCLCQVYNMPIPRKSIATTERTPHCPGIILCNLVNAIQPGLIRTPERRLPHQQHCSAIALAMAPAMAFEDRESAKCALQADGYSVSNWHLVAVQVLEWNQGVIGWYPKSGNQSQPYSHFTWTPCTTGAALEIARRISPNFWMLPCPQMMPCGFAAHCSGKAHLIPKFSDQQNTTLIEPALASVV